MQLRQVLIHHPVNFFKVLDEGVCIERDLNLFLVHLIVEVFTRRQAFVDGFELCRDFLGDSFIFIAGGIEVPEEIRKLFAGIATLDILHVIGKFERTWHRVVPEHSYVATGWAAGTPANEVSTGSQVLL
jgi:hypothetical protein